MAEARAVTYCSFAEPGKCLGVVVLTGELDVVTSAQLAWKLGINPGGQMMAASCKETDPDVPTEIFEAMWVNRDRLIPGDEARELFEAKSIREFEEEAANVPK